MRAALSGTQFNTFPTASGMLKNVHSKHPIAGRHLCAPIKAGLFTKKQEKVQNVQEVINKSGDNRSPRWGTAPTLQISAPVTNVEDDIAFPSLEWILDLGFVVLKILLNSIATSGSSRQSTAGLTEEYLEDLRSRFDAKVAAARYKLGGEFVDEETAVPVEEVEEEEDTKQLKKEIMQLFELLKEIIIEGATAPQTIPGMPHSVADYKALFKTIPLPEIAESFETDEAFAKMRVAGPNPMMLTGITRSELVDLVGGRLSDAEFNEALGTTGDSVQSAGDQGRLCVANYKPLSATDPNIALDRSFVVNPIAIFAEPVDGDFLKPVAIQLGQDPRSSEMVFASTEDTIMWQIAKTTVQVADANHHELIIHLAYTHLVMEAFSVATQRTLSKDHCLHKLLMPHFEGTNFINRLAATDLIAPGGQIDTIFAADQEPRMETLQHLAVGTRVTFDFTGRMPDVELKSRNIDQLKVFPYRDDALLVWEAVLRWTRDYVDLYFEDDQDVKYDTGIVPWAKDIETNALFQNFRAPESKEELSRTLAMIIFTGSAQHAAVNFPQQSYMTFAPAFSGVVWDNLPEGSPAKEEQWLKMLPPMPVAELQLRILYLLGGVYYRRLGIYRSNRLPYLKTLDRKAKDALEKFNEELNAIETIITNRNLSRGYFSYDFLLPSRIPPSINI